MARMARDYGELLREQEGRRARERRTVRQAVFTAVGRMYSTLRNQGWTPAEAKAEIRQIVGEVIGDE